MVGCDDVLWVLPGPLAWQECTHAFMRNFSMQICGRELHDWNQGFKALSLNPKPDNDTNLQRPAVQYMLTETGRRQTPTHLCSVVLAAANGFLERRRSPLNRCFATLQFQYLK